MAYAGRPVRRFEDRSLISGGGRYVADLERHGTLHAAVLRSPYAHARIRSMSAVQARDAPGVIAAFSGSDLAGVVGDIPATPRAGATDVVAPGHPVLARERVCYVGQPVAVVVAESGYQARDALEMMDVEYEPLPAVVDAVAAAAAGAPLTHPDLGSNIGARSSTGRGDMERARRSADLVLVRRFAVPRLSAVPLEPRVVMARYEPDQDSLTVWTSSQSPHRVKRCLEGSLREVPSRLRVVTPDVGGGFGQKADVFPEELAMASLSRLLGRPVRWAEERTENMLCYHGRGHAAEVEAAVRRDGRVLGMRYTIWCDLGAYVMTLGLAPLVNVSHRVAGPYAIDVWDVTTLGVMTNKPPTGPYRGAGGPEAAFFAERAMDVIASELDMDPVEVRRRNMIQPDAFPYETGTDLVYDSGQFPGAMERALDLAGYESWRGRQRDARRRREGPLVGIGLATVVKASGGMGESRSSLARVRVEPSGSVVLATEVLPHGQGTDTSFAQIAADVLGTLPEHVQVMHGDTDLLADGQGTYASRGLTVGGSAVYTALHEVRRKLARLAAHRLGCLPEEVEMDHGGAFRRGDRRPGIGLPKLATALYEGEGLPEGMQPGLEFTASYNLPGNAFGFAAHVAVVEVDRETGQVRFQRYVAVHDVGAVINPLLAEGQIHGGVAQGVGMALTEAVTYDGDGQPLGASLMEYAIPCAQSVPEIVVDVVHTPSSTNPLGTRGLGELPTVASPVAVANAVVDALAPLGVSHLEPPVTPEKVWRAINQIDEREW